MNKRTMNHNAAEMKLKYDISHMIAAFEYEQVYFSTGEREVWQNLTPGYIVAYNLPSRMTGDLNKDLASMAGWAGPDNKVAYLVVTGGLVALFSFYDGSCKMIEWSPFGWEMIPANIHRGRERVLKAYTEWREGFLNKVKLERRARNARMLGHNGENAYTNCTRCGEKTTRREMGTPICDGCATRCEWCSSTRCVRKSERSGKNLCNYCTAGEARDAGRTHCDICGCSHDSPYYTAGMSCTWDKCGGKLIFTYPELQLEHEKQRL